MLFTRSRTVCVSLPNTTLLPKRKVEPAVAIVSVSLPVPPALSSEQGHHEVTEFNLHGLLGLRLSLRLLCPWVYKRPPGGCFGVFQKLHRDVSCLSHPKHGWEGEECWWGHLGHRWGLGLCGGYPPGFPPPVESASAAFNALMPFLRAAA